MRLANMSNGLVYQHDGVCYFQSQHAHRYSTGYFGVESMPLAAVAHLLRGGTVTIIDATRKQKPLTDALKVGVPTWALTFNRAVGLVARVCPWETREMRHAANSCKHHGLRQTIRKLARYYGVAGPVVVGANLVLECHQGAAWDDKFEEIARLCKASAL